MSRDMRRAAIHRLYHFAGKAEAWASRPVERADARTSIADSRAALCVALGVPLDLIDPASGHDLSKEGTS